MRTFCLKAVGIPMLCLLGVYAFVTRSKPLPFDELAKMYPVGSMVSQSIKDKPYQDRLFFARPFEWKPYYQIKPLAIFRVAGYVLGARSYEGEPSANSQHSPVDFGLAWGKAATPGIYNLLNCSQSHRFLNYEPRGLDESDYKTLTANIHIVPENDELKTELMKVGVGDKVRLAGYLVKITSEDGWTWKSSTVRWDSGDGACEVLLVTDFELIEKAKKKKKKKRRR